MLLGYSEHSAFTRAFRKQNGMSPQQMRDQVSREVPRS
ncbi:MAG: helix-turn-helix transcriptional regulator [Abyssibacter sp.]|nr:helix-turn-helix transcriptional regulator [Abyssibacter sp.]